jgi:hypothetical protein
MDGKKIEYQHQHHSRWGGAPIGRPIFTAPEYFWRVAPPDPPKPTIVDWQPIDTNMPTGKWLLITDGYSVTAGRRNRLTEPMVVPYKIEPTHWAPMPAPPQGDK